MFSYATLTAQAVSHRRRGKALTEAQREALTAGAQTTRLCRCEPPHWDRDEDGDRHCIKCGRYDK